MPYDFFVMFYEQAYGCSISKKEWKKREAETTEGMER